MLIDFLFELRAKKLPVSTHEWLALMEAMALGLHESSLDGFYHLCRTICVKDIALYDAYDEAFLAYFKDIHVERARADEAAPGVAARSRRRSSGSPTSSAQTLKDARPREAARAVRGAPEGAEGAPRRRQPLDRHRRHVAVRHGGAQPDRHARRRWRRAHARWRSPTSGGSRSTARDLVLDVRQIDVALRGLRRLGREGALEELDLDETIDETGQQRRRARDRVPAAAPQPRQGAAADGRRRLDGSARRADVAAVHRGVAHRPVREVPQLLLSQLRLQLGLRGRAVPQAGAGRRPARDQRSRREARHRRRRADAPGRAARSGRLDVPVLADPRVGHRVAAPARAPLPQRARGSTPSPSGSGPARRSR